jgi:hypothetical protein
MKTLRRDRYAVDDPGREERGGSEENADEEGKKYGRVPGCSIAAGKDVREDEKCGRDEASTRETEAAPELEARAGVQ